MHIKYLLPLLLVCSCHSNDADNKSASSSPKKSNSKNEDAGKGDCSAYYWFKEGRQITYLQKNADGKTTGETIVNINKVSSSGDTLIAEIATTIGNKIEPITLKYKCIGTKVLIDLNSMLSNNMFKTMMTKKNMSMEMSSGYLEFPYSMKVGDELAASAVEIKVKMDNSIFMSATSKVNSRKVEAKENVTTPAGSWNCYRISEQREMIMDMKGMTMPAQKTKSEQWFADGFGIVKQNFYDADGKLQLSSELKEIKN